MLFGEDVRHAGGMCGGSMQRLCNMRKLKVWEFMEVLKKIRKGNQGKSMCSAACLTDPMSEEAFSVDW